MAPTRAVVIHVIGMSYELLSVDTIQSGCNRIVSGSVRWRPMYFHVRLGGRPINSRMLFVLDAAAAADNWVSR